MIKKRGGGILLHVTSLPSEYGIGDFGPGAYRFADWLAAARQSYWQILPMNQTTSDAGNSPYSTLSAFAGNPLVISPELLYRDGLLTRREIQDPPRFPEDRVDFPKVIAFKHKLFNAAWERFKIRPRREGFLVFQHLNRYWLDDYVLYKVLRDYYRPRLWCDWPVELRDRDPRAVGQTREKFKDQIDREEFLQYTFSEQWWKLKTYCNERRIQIIGDIAIYVGYDSADVWANPEIFQLDKKKKPKVVAGFPPDVFCTTGQLWGNPLYDWKTLKARDYDWWIRRIKRKLSIYNALRIDHFRGFITYWEVPAGHKTAQHGRWMDGPKDDFFSALFKYFAFPPIIVEVLGYITPEIREYMEQLHLPGMRLLIYAFDSDDPTGQYYPHNHIRNAVAYTGTHDNNTIRGWFDHEATAAQKRRLYTYLGRKVTSKEIHWEMVRLAMESVCLWCIIPVQDVLGLGAEARMNKPGCARGQWEWRVSARDLTPALARKLGDLAYLTGRA